MFVQVVYPDPGRKMGVICVEEELHLVLDKRCYILALGMVNPVLCGIGSQWKILDVILVNMTTELKEYAEGCTSKKCMRWSQEDVKVGHMNGVCNTI
jgi:hypothetical protein